MVLSGRSAVGSAPRSGRGGRWFKSSRPDQNDQRCLMCLNWLGLFVLGM